MVRELVGRPHVRGYTYSRMPRKESIVSGISLFAKLSSGTNHFVKSVLYSEVDSEDEFESSALKLERIDDISMVYNRSLIQSMFCLIRLFL